MNITISYLLQLQLKSQ